MCQLGTCASDAVVIIVSDESGDDIAVCEFHAEGHESFAIACN